MFSFDVRDRGDEELAAWRRAMAAARSEGEGADGARAGGERTSGLAGVGDVRSSGGTAARAVPMEGDGG